MTAFSRGFKASMFSIEAVMSSRADTCFVRTRSASESASCEEKSFMVGLSISRGRHYLTRLTSREHLVAFLVRPHQLRLIQDVSLHRLLEVWLLCRRQVQSRIECIELEEVAMPTNRRARPSIASLAEIVRAVHRSRGNRH